MSRALMACFLATALAACSTVSTIPMEPQNKEKDSRLARLYFIWPLSAMMRTATIDVKVNGQTVGKIAPDSYLFVDRQPGTYTLKVEPPLDFDYFETDVQVAADATYYYAISMKPGYVPLSGGGVVTISHPQHGTALPPKGGGVNFATYKLNALEPAAAAAEMAKLQKQ
jgi:hypothetical protein